MFKRPRPIDQQVVVITGGTSGISLETARFAGRKGARIVIAARSSEGLRKAAAELFTIVPPRSRRRRLDFATQLSDVGVQMLTTGVEGPEALKDEFISQRLSCMPNEQPQQLIFL